MVHVVGTPYVEDFDVYELSGDPVTGLTGADFTTKTAFLLSDPTGTTQPVTISGTGPTYYATFTPSVVGDWSLRIARNVVPVQRWGNRTPIEVVTAAQADPAGALAGATISYNGPVTPSGDVEIYRADDYAESDSRELPWTLSGAAALPDLTGATVKLYAKHRTAQLTGFTAHGDIDTPTGSTRSFHVEVPASATADLSPGKYDFSVVATLTNGNDVTLTAGTLIMKAGGRST